MKAKTFENLIRKVVREEIDYALRREIKSLKEDLRDEISPQMVEQKQPNISPISEEAKNTLKEKIMGKAPIKKPINQTFSSNSTLNDLLTETAMGDTNTQVANSPVDLSAPFASGAPLPVETQGMPEDVANAVTRDYSDLMKAIDKRNS